MGICDLYEAEDIVQSEFPHGVKIRTIPKPL